LHVVLTAACDSSREKQTLSMVMLRLSCSIAKVKAGLLAERGGYPWCRV